MPKKLKFTQDDVNVRLRVTLSVCVTIGLYNKPIDVAVVAEHVKTCIDLEDSIDGIGSLIDKIEIEDVHLDDHTVLVEAEG
jgi:urease gamma subunit